MSQHDTLTQVERACATCAHYKIDFVEPCTSCGDYVMWEPAALSAAQPAQAQQAGEPVAWRWRNCVGDWVTGWLDYKPSQRACIEQQVAEAGGIIQYAYATTPPATAQPSPPPAQPAPVVPEGWQPVPLEADSAILRPFYNCPPDELGIAWAAAVRVAQVKLTASPTPPAQQPAGGPA